MLCVKRSRQSGAFFGCVQTAEHLSFIPSGEYDDPSRIVEAWSELVRGVLAGASAELAARGADVPELEGGLFDDLVRSVVIRTTKGEQ